jgi:2-iminobutanoate/2-iminopropanoate deaminase
MTRATVSAPDLAPLGVWAGDLLQASDQVGQVPATHAVVAGGIEAETHQTFENIRRDLAAAGLGFDDVIKARVYLADMNDFAVMNAIYEEAFVEPFLACTTVQIAKLALIAPIKADVAARRLTASGS